MSIILETNKLTIGYAQKNNETIVAQGIDLAFEKGTLVALLGENGVGKSTLLRTLSGVQKPLQGTVSVKGKLVQEYTGVTLATTVSLVLTERLRESQLTVYELIALGRQPYTNWVDTLTAIDHEKINWAMVETAVTSLKEQLVFELSDGQLQRVLIARALAQDTDLILLDEPTAHLDIHHTFNVFSLLEKLAKTTKKTIIVSTHEVNLAIQYADQLVLLTKEEVHSGTVASLQLENAFENLFPKEFVNFNRTLQQFVVRTSI